MDVSFFHGPDRTPFDVDGDGRVLAAAGTPFHGVASLGLIAGLGDDPRAIAAWHEHAHRLDDDGGQPDAELLRLRDVARRSGVLTFGQSALAARRFVEAICSRDDTLAVDSVSLWNVKEGQVSSVWFCSLFPDPTEDGRQFVINVARDDTASVELHETSGRMQAIATERPGLLMADVLEVGSVALPIAGGPHPVTVTRNELVADALELARLPVAAGDRAVYAAVERFVTEPEAPAQIRSVRGRAMSDRECRRVDADVAEFLAVARSVSAVTVDISRGDIVWDGRHAVVVAVRSA